MADRSSAFSVRFDPETAVHARRPALTQILRCRADLTRFAGKGLLQLLCACAAAFSFAMIPQYLGRLIDLFANSIADAVILDSFKVDRTALLQCVIPAAVLLLLHAVFFDLSGRLASSIASGYADRMRRRIFDKILCVRMDYLDAHAKKDIHTVATETVDAAGQSLNLLCARVLYARVMLASLVAVCARTSLFQAVLLGTTILLFALVRLLRVCVRTPQTPAPAPVDMDEYYRNLPALHVCGKSRQLSRALIQAQEDTLRTVQRSRFSDSFSRITAVLLTGLAVSAVLLRSAYADEAVGIGSLVSLILYIRRAESPMTDIGFFSASARALADACANLYDFLDAPEENTCGHLPAADTDGRYRVTFRDVQFAYTPHSAKILDSFSCTFPDRGLHIIRGETGVGKTTLLKLLTGFYLPQSGSVCVGGVSTAQLDARAYRTLFSVIVQEASLFERTVAENIAYPDTHADPQRIAETLEQLGQTGLTDALQNALQTVFRPDAHTLSDGQIQLVLIARALYHRKRFLILDESLSHLDADSMQKILRVLRTVSAETGVILISHRSADIPGADSVVSL